MRPKQSIMIHNYNNQNVFTKIRDHPKLMTTKLVTLGLGNPYLSILWNREWILLGFVFQMIHGIRLIDQSKVG